MEHQVDKIMLSLRTLGVAHGVMQVTSGLPLITTLVVSLLNLPTHLHENDQNAKK